MDLVLWRHAHAEDITDAGGDDMARALTTRGQRQAEEVGAWLHRRLPRNAIVLSSPALRAVQTARALPRDHAIVDAMGPDRGTVEALLEAAGWWGPPRSLRSLPSEGAGPPWERPGGGPAPGAAASSRTVVFVGHQPVLGQAAALLMCGQAQSWSVKKGAAWWLRMGPRDDACELWMVRSPTA
jgi:phosphohistidine phosphatase